LAPVSVSVGDQNLVTGYEALRHQAVTGNRGDGKALGMTLFLRQGMRSWIEVWRCSQENAPVAQRSESDPDYMLAVDLRSEIAMLLTSMVLNTHTEVSR
jgi:hypothetical protein